jgi:hypothetical protein
VSPGSPADAVGFEQRYSQIREREQLASVAAATERRVAALQCHDVIAPKHALQA